MKWPFEMVPPFKKAFAMDSNVHHFTWFFLYFSITIVEDMCNLLENFNAKENIWSSNLGCQMLVSGSPYLTWSKTLLKLSEKSLDYTKGCGISIAKFQEIPWGYSCALNHQHWYGEQGRKFKLRWEMHEFVDCNQQQCVIGDRIWEAAVSADMWHSWCPFLNWDPHTYCCLK